MQINSHFLLISNSNKILKHFYKSYQAFYFVHFYAFLSRLYCCIASLTDIDPNEVQASHFALSAILKAEGSEAVH